MEPDDIPIRDPYWTRVQAGDIVRLPGRRVAIVTRVYKVGGFLPAVEVRLVIATRRERIMRHLAGTNIFLDEQIKELTFVA